MKVQFKPLSNPILLVSDGMDHHTGLARIGRDLATLIATLPQFRVGYLGLGSIGRRKLPIMQYSLPDGHGFGEHHIQEVWHDFAGEEPGIIMSLWDVSRMLWFGQPQMNTIPGLAQFLGEGRNFEKWGYFPVDATGPDGVRLGVGMRAALSGYDRVLVASERGRDVLKCSGRGDADWMPHGLWMNNFKPYGSLTYCKRITDWEESQIHVGCNMANQSRKDFPIAFETVAILRQHYGNRLRFWLHTDVPIRYWNIYALAQDFGIDDCMEITTALTDEQLALRYSACDCTILPSAGEGFGFPIAESMACGTACVVTDYAAGPELVPEDCRVKPVTYRIDTQHNVQRAVLSGYGFAARAQDQIEKKRLDWEGRSEEVRAGVEHLGWEKLKTVWTRWLLDGLKP